MAKGNCRNGCGLKRARGEKKKVCRVDKGGMFESHYRERAEGQKEHSHDLGDRGLHSPSILAGGGDPVPDAGVI